MRRVADLVIDLIDGVLAAVLYSRQGSVPYTLHDAENLNESNLRKWSAASASSRSDGEDDRSGDLEARIRAFRARAKKIEKR